MSPKIKQNQNISFRSYYESRSHNLKNLNAHKEKILELESRVIETKATYNETLRSLELISEEIHKMRQEKYKLAQHLNNTIIVEHSNKSNTMHDYLDEYLDFPNNTTSLRPNHSDSHLEAFTRSQGYAHIGDAQDETSSEHWTEILLTQSPMSDDLQKTITSPDDVNDDDDDDGEDDDNEGGEMVETGNNMDKMKKKNAESNVTNWITKSNIKSKDRRQSLDILYDASDKVKDVFTQGFQKVGRTLERRNSESEATMDFFFNRLYINLFLNIYRIIFFKFYNTNFFFDFRAEQLTDEQVENLLLSRSLTSLYDEYLTVTK